MPSVTHAPVTVVIPMYQTAAYIAEALDSIHAQTLRPERVIVVDDGSTDLGPAIVAARNDVELLRRPHLGIGPTIDAGLALVRSEYVAILDADDRWLPGKTAIQLACLRDQLELGMVFGHARRFVMTPAGEQHLDVMPGIYTSGGLFRRSMLDLLGPWMHPEGSHCFFNWYNRTKESGVKELLLPDIICERRIHDSNHGILNRAEQRRAYFTTIKAALDRRRAAP